MKEDFKILNTINPETAELFLYGTIGRGCEIDTTQLIPELETLNRDGVKNLVIYLNSDGGEVIQGQTLFNYFLRCDFSIKWIVDGIAASMAALLISNPAHRVEMCKYSKLMYHKVTGGTGGTAENLREYANTLEMFENDLIQMLSARTGLSEEDIKTRFFNGRDNWISAPEALEVGLCDKIISGHEDITEPDTSITDRRQMVNYYTKQIFSIKNQSNMNLKKVASILNVAENASDDVIYNAVQKMAQSRATLLNTVKEKNEQIQALNAKIKTFEDAKIKSLIDEAIQNKKFTEDLRPTYTAFAKSDFEGAKKAINQMPGVDKIVNHLQGGNGEGLPELEKGWTWDDYFKNNRLEDLQNKNPERFNALYKAKYNKDYQPK